MRPFHTIVLAACALSLAPSCNRFKEAKAGLASQKPSDVPPNTRPSAKVAEVVPLPVCNAKGIPPLDAARKSYDKGHYDVALSCAAQASALDPDEPQAHSERGAALTALGRLDEARLAYARALALNPDHLDALLGAAHLYGVSMPSSRDNDELAALYAERGRRLATEAGDKKTEAEFALLSAMALNDLGEASEAVSRAEEVLNREPANTDALYERAVALFELCKFKDAQAAFSKLLDDKEHAPHAHQHLGLLLEREAKWKEAQAHFDKARQLAPGDFPVPQLLSEQEFSDEVKKAVERLPADMRRDLKGVPVRAEELPKDEDLMSGDPPLSPSILGLYRGPPLSETCGPDDGNPCRSVALYRRNLARAVQSREELLEQIRVTLLHEVGHLRGEDDLELAARGLE
jgi:tetratricopeptide (TPR) repeat protein